MFPEDRTVPAAGNDPELRAGNRAVHLQRQLHWIERIAIAVDDQRASADRREVRRREVHVGITVPEPARDREQRLNLLIAASVPLALDSALRFRNRVEGKLSHDGARFRLGSTAWC